MPCHYFVKSGAKNPRCKGLSSCFARQHPCARQNGGGSPELANGFSLIELLVVVAIIGMLAYFVVPTIQSISSARGIADSANRIAEAVEFARSEAVARRTYVWLGFENLTQSGIRIFVLGGVYSKDGSANAASANIQPLFRSVVLEQVGLVGSADTGANNSSYTGASALATSTLGITFSSGSRTFSSKTTVTFTPTGEVMLTGLPTSTTAFESQILIGIRSFRGTTAATNNDIAVVIDGASGIPTVYHKQ